MKEDEPMLCAGCGRLPHTGRSGCRCISERVWALPELRLAWEERDAAAVVRLVLWHSELSQTKLAAITGVSQSAISDALSGKSQFKRPSTRDAVFDGLRAHHQGAPPVPPAIEYGHTLAPTTFKPRTGQRSAEPQGMWNQVLEGSVPEVVKTLRLADRRIVRGSLYTIVMRYLSRRVGPALVSEHGGPDTFLAAAGLTEMAGWMAHDAGRDDLATRHLQRALNLARAADSDALTAQIWASRAHLALHQTETETALNAAEQAWRHLDGREDTALRGRTLAMLTRAHAARGDTTTAHTFLAQAEHLLSVPAAASRSQWTSPFDWGSLAGEAARSLFDLGDCTAAAEHAHHALRLRSPERVRARALASLTLARSLIGQGQVEEAAVVTGQVAGTAAAEGSVVAGTHLRAVAGELRPYRQVSEVATVLRQVQGTLARAGRERLSIEGGTP